MGQLATIARYAPHCFIIAMCKIGDAERNKRLVASWDILTYAFEFQTPEETETLVIFI